MIKELALNRIWPGGSLKTHHRVINNQSQASRLRVWLSAALVSLNVLLLLSYIYGVNQFASQGYEITALQTRLTGLNTSNKQLNLKIAQAASMVSIQNDFLNSGYVLAATPKFLQTENLSLR
ncbi:MAG: hypothetical protein P4L74_06270 [Candidatus Doudnabacteria bacterium]|nr:hypothetical protein [Candidatus Doudnabacteria bacterium]